MPDDDYVLVHDSAMTNTRKNSVVEVLVNTKRICQNMPNKAFRNVIIECQDIAVSLIQERIRGLARWDRSERARVEKFLGRSDDEIRAYLKAGLHKLLDVMKALKP